MSEVDNSDLITPREALEIASQWGSLIRAGDPGAVFYTFGDDATPQGPRHRAQLIAYTKDCIEKLALPCYDDEREELKAELESLLAFFERFPDSGEETREEYADESRAIIAGADRFARAYLTAAMFTGVEYPDGHPDKDSDKEYDLDPAGIKPDSIRDMLADCKAFQEKAADLLAEAYSRDGYSHAESGAGPEDMAGHDFWLTRNGHGAGFWDRSALDADGLGDKLTEVAKGFGESDLYRGDDGAIYIS